MRFLLFYLCATLLLGCNARYAVAGQSYSVRPSGENVTLVNIGPSAEIDSLLSRQTWSNNYVTYAPGPPVLYSQDTNLLVFGDMLVGRVAGENGLKATLSPGDVFELRRLLKIADPQ